MKPLPLLLHPALRWTHRVARCGGSALLAVIVLLTSPLHAEPQPPPLDDARVTLPYGELLRLVGEARAPHEKVPPVRCALLNADYRVSLAGKTGLPSTLRIEAAFLAENFTDGPVLLPVLPGNLAIHSEETPGQADQAPLLHQEGQLALLLRTTGRQTSRISFSPTEWKERDSGWEVRFPGLPAASRTLRIEAVPDGWVLDVPGAALHPGPEGGVWQFQLPPGQSTVRLIAMKEDEAPEAGSWSVRSEIFAEREDGILQFTAHVSAWPEQENPRQLVLRLPAGARQIEVAALPGKQEAGSAEIRTSAPDAQNPPKREVVIRRAPGAEGEWQFGLRYQTPLDALAETWPLLGPETDGNIFFLSQPAGVELRKADSAPANELPAPEVSALPDWLARTLAANEGTGRIRVFRGDAELALHASYLPAVKMEDLTVAQLALSTRLARDGALFAEAVFDIEHRTVQPFSFTLPEGSQLVGASLQGKPVQILRREKEYEVLLPAAASRQDSVSKLQVSYTGNLAAFDPVSGGLSLALHHGRHFTRQLRWTILLPENYEAAGVESNAEVKAAAEPGAILLERSFAAGSAPAVEASVFYRRRGLAQNR